MVWKYECRSQKKNPQDVKEGGASQGSVKDRFLQYTMQNQAEYAIIPLADILGLGKRPYQHTGNHWFSELGVAFTGFYTGQKELQKFGRLIVDTKR